jgi:hypothetical protein
VGELAQASSSVLEKDETLAWQSFEQPVVKSLIAQAGMSVLNAALHKSSTQSVGIGISSCSETLEASGAKVNTAANVAAFRRRRGPDILLRWSNV